MNRTIPYLFVAALAFAFAGGLQTVVDAKKSSERNARVKDVIDLIDHKFTAEAKPLNDVMDLAPSLRQKNWVAHGGGSCVIASSISLLRWPGEPELNRKADEMRKRYGGGQSPGSMTPKFKDMGIRYVVTTDGDWQLIKWACDTRRGCAVGYGAGHCQNLVGMTKTHVILMDNNHPQRFDRVEIESFKRKWRSLGGWAFSFVYDPPPPAPR